MNKFRSLLLAAVGSAMLFSGPMAEAQNVNSSVYAYPGQLVSHIATKIGLAPAASATDFLTFTGPSAGKYARVQKIHCDGVSTANATALIQLVKRSSVDTGGTSTAVTPIKMNTNSVNATATVAAYTANPTLGVSIGIGGEKLMTSNTLATSTVNNTGVDWDFTGQFMVIQPGQQLALNANGVSFSAGMALNCSIQWSE